MPVLCLLRSVFRFPSERLSLTGAWNAAPAEGEAGVEQIFPNNKVSHVVYNTGPCRTRPEAETVEPGVEAARDKVTQESDRIGVMNS